MQLSFRCEPLGFAIVIRRLCSLLLLLACVVCACGQTPPPPPEPTPSVVYRAYDPGALDGFTVDTAVVRRMVDDLVMAVTHQSDVASAWRSLVSPKDKVGIKISAAGGELFTTHRAVVDAIVDGLVAAGQAREKIVVWDRSLGGIRKAGYTGNEGYQLRDIPPRDGYDPKVTISAPFLGKLIWGDYEYVGGKGELPLLTDDVNTSSVSHLARIVVHDVTKIINVPVLSNSERNGVAGCLYNLTIPNVDNWRRFGIPPDYGASTIPEIYSDPHVGRKVVLNLMDGLFAQYAGGPQSQPNYAFTFDTLYASRDPVAIDSIALRQINQWRKQRHLPAIGHTGDHVEVAAQMGLGNANPRKIEVRNVGR